MNYGLIPMPASEELAMGYIPLFNSSRAVGEPISLRLIAALYLLMLLVIFLFPSAPPSADAQAEAVHTAAQSGASCPDCIHTPALSPQTKD